MEVFDFAWRILLAILAGFFIGLERQITGHLAGIHTNVLVALGSCLFVLFSHIVGTGDATRVAAQVVTGVGFLCSGIIFKEGLNVKGLKTAATLWCSAAIGVLSSLGLVMHVGISVLMLVTSNTVFPIIASKVISLVNMTGRDDEEQIYIFSVTCDEKEEFHVRQTIIRSMKNAKLRIIHLESADQIGNKVEIEATVQVLGSKKDELIERIVTKVAMEKSISKVGWNREE